MAIKKILEYISEKHIFYFVLALNVVLLLTVKFYPTLDGPAHLYNSNLILQILSDKPIASFYSLNDIFIPNWTGHFILSVFNSFLPGWMAEKVLLILYVASLAISFRLLVNALNPERNGLSVLIFPFTFSFLFYMGFYNYCISFIFLFLALYLWVKTCQRQNLSYYLVLFVLLALTYFSAILTFFFAGLCMGLYTLAYAFYAYKTQKGGLHTIAKRAGRELFRLFLVSLPLLVFSYIFIGSVNFAPASDRLTANELIKWLIDVRCLIVYNYSGDAGLTRIFLFIFLAIALISVYTRKNLHRRIIFRVNDILFLPFLLALLLFLTIPTSANAGMMSDRFCLFLYILLIIWLSVQTLPKFWGRVFVGLIVILHIALLLKHHNSGIRDLNKRAITVNDAAVYMKDNSVVLPVNMSDNWLELHFSNYLGVDKPLVILENYEASVGWFPVKWNGESLPGFQTAGYDQIQGLSWFSNVKAGKKRQIDYIFLYGNISKLNEDQWLRLKEVLNTGYKLVFTSTDKYVALYEVQTKI